ncbi:MAG: hypothetical protein ACRC1L_10740 [Prochlorococcaceae cyanobacterium]
MGSLTRRQRPFGLLLAGLLALPALPATASGPSFAGQAADPLIQIETHSELLAKKGGGGGSGGNKGGKSGARAKSSKGSSGFKNSGSSLNKGNKKPKGGWSSSQKGKQKPSLEKTSAKKHDNNKHKGNQSKSSQSNKDKLERRDDKLDSKADKLDRREDKLDKRDRKLDRRADRYDDRWDNRWDDRWDRYPGWARPGWGYARPWNAGWYGGWSEPSWGWWGANAATWGISTLTTAAIINSAVDNAVNDHVTYISVPNSDYQLLYGTVAPSGSQSVRFEVGVGNSEIEMVADCDRGSLNGRNPSTMAEAELLNAACQVAYGSV